MIAEILAYIALIFGTLFFTYAVRYYIALIMIAISLFRNSSSKNNALTNGAAGGYGLRIRAIGNNKQNSNGENNLREPPMVSIHIPLYNEERVVDRLMEALTSLDYPNYEVIVVDDSTDSTVEKLKKWSKHSKVKIIHRENRRGFKGGALNEALKHMSEKAEYVVVFDADFIPPKNILWEFLRFFERNNGNNHNNRFESWREDNLIVAVQGYQWHVLNASENWITRAVTAEYAGNYLVERVYLENLPGIKMIAGSVFMIKADILRRYGWRESLTEDWDLTLRLYRDGYKVAYTPIVAAPAECPSTVTALMRQRARWAEGHTYAVKKYIKEILRSRFLSLREKLEFIYLTPYYLNSFFFLIGTFCWLLAELLQAKIPFWTSIFGWSLLLTNLMAIPLVNLTGLFLEYRASRHWTGSLAFIPLMHVLAIAQAIASLKGLVEKKESAWFRTLKTGKITELNIFLRLRKMIGREKRKERKVSKKLWTTIIIVPLILSIARTIQTDPSWKIFQNNINSIFYVVTLSFLAIPIILHVMKCRRLYEMKPILVKTMALLTTTLLIITLTITPTPVRAYVPQQTLYFYPDGGQYPSESPGALSTDKPSTGKQELKFNSLYWWASKETYNFEDEDDGVWLFYFYGHVDKDAACHKGPCVMTIDIHVSKSRDVLGERVGSTTIIIDKTGGIKFEDVQIYVDLHKCERCYIQIVLKLENKYGSYLEMYTGFSKQYTILMIPENIFMLFVLLLLCTMYMKWRKNSRSKFPNLNY